MGQHSISLVDKRTGEIRTTISGEILQQILAIGYFAWTLTREVGKKYTQKQPMKETRMFHALDPNHLFSYEKISYMYMEAIMA